MRKKAYGFSGLQIRDRHLVPKHELEAVVHKYWRENLQKTHRYGGMYVERTRFADTLISPVLRKILKQIVPGDIVVFYSPYMFRTLEVLHRCMGRIHSYGAAVVFLNAPGGVIRTDTPEGMLLFEHIGVSVELAGGLLLMNRQLSAASIAMKYGTVLRKTYHAPKGLK